MTKLISRTLAVAAAAGAMTAATPLFAQASKVATVNPAEALFSVQSLPTALQQVETKYAAQIRAANDRRTALQAQVKPLYDQLDTNKDGNLDQAEQQAAVQAQRPQVKQIRDAESAAQTAIGQTMQPVITARIYVFDQLQKRYNASLDSLVQSRQIGLVVPAASAIRQSPGTDLTAAIRTDIDKPLAVDPPAGWQPTREGAALLETYLQALAEAEQRIAQQQQGAARPAGTAPTAPATPAGPTRPARDRNGDPIRQ